MCKVRFTKRLWLCFLTRVFLYVWSFVFLAPLAGCRGFDLCVFHLSYYKPNLYSLYLTIKARVQACGSHWNGKERSENKIAKGSDFIKQAPSLTRQKVRSTHEYTDTSSNGSSKWLCSKQRKSRKKRHVEFPVNIASSITGKCARQQLTLLKYMLLPSTSDLVYTESIGPSSLQQAIYLTRGFRFHQYLHQQRENIILQVPIEKLAQRQESTSQLIPTHILHIGCWQQHK